VLFTDLVGFTGISEQLDKQTLIDWLNEYFERLSGLVRASGGNINKFNGDQIMAVFGPPLVREGNQVTTDARGAVTCAVRMRAELQKANQTWIAAGRPNVRMRIGVHTGEVIAGSLGSRDRQEWTVVGDTVNIASRLESFDKSQMSPDIAADVCRILISDSTMDRLDHNVLQACSLGHHELAGREHKIEVIAVIDYGPGVVTPSVTKAPPMGASEKGSDQPCTVA
jgi:adenylate cyclase